jgi:hypothetical protein
MSLHNWQKLAFFSLLILAMGVLCLLKINPQTGVPQRAELAIAEGKLAWMQKGKYGTRFGLIGANESFNYPTKARGISAVRGALECASNKIVSVQYELDSHGPIYSDEKYHDVWGLKVGDQTVRTYEETVASWEDDNLVAPWLGAAMLGFGLFLGYLAWRTY